MGRGREMEGGYKRNNKIEEKAKPLEGAFWEDKELKRWMISNLTK